MASNNKEESARFLELGAERLLRNCQIKYKNQHEYDFKAALRDLGCAVQFKEEWTGRGGKISTEEQFSDWKITHFWEKGFFSNSNNKNLKINITRLIAGKRCLCCLILKYEFFVRKIDLRPSLLIPFFLNFEKWKFCKITFVIRRWLGYTNWNVRNRSIIGGNMNRRTVS